MADVTMGFKISDDLKAKAQEMIEASGLKSKEWFEQVIQLAEMQGLKEGAPAFANDIAELELHTSRINHLVANMIQRAEFQREEVSRKIDEIKESRDRIILDMQKELSDLGEQLKKAKADAETAMKAQAEAEAAQAELQGTLTDSRALATEYKLKNDALTEKLAHYDELLKQTQQLSEVNRQLEATNAAQGAQIEQQAKELTVLRQQNEHLQQKAETQRAEMSTAHTEELKQLKAAHQEELKRADAKRIDELERLSEKSKLEMEKAVLAVRSELQEKHQVATEAHANEVRDLYAEIRRLETKNE